MILTLWGDSILKYVVSGAGASSSRNETSSEGKLSGQEYSIAEILSFDDAVSKKKMSDMRNSKKIAKKKGKKR